MITCLALSASLDVSYLVDELLVGGIAVPRSVHRTAGGKALNAARAAAMLGASVRAVAVLGGYAGEHIASLLRDTEVELLRVEANTETRSCLSIAAGNGDGLTELYEQAPPLGALSWASFVSAVDELPPVPGDWVLLSGSVPAGVPHDELAALLMRRQRAGMRIAIDSHGPALDNLLALLTPDLVKINRVEAAALLASKAPVPQLVQAIADRTGNLVVVTDGARGSWAGEGGRLMRLTVDGVNGAYPVGSGDCYLGGLVAGLDSGEPLAKSLSRGVAAATANALTPGAGTFLPTDFSAVLAEVRLAEHAAPDRVDSGEAKR